MNTTIHQKISELFRQWSEIVLASVRPVPIPIKVQIDEANHRRQISNRQYQILKQRDIR